MKTTYLNNIEKKWILIDAKDEVVGRLAVKIANILRGKNKVQFAPHLDTGDFVIVVNADKIRFTGGKLKDKKYFSHSGYIGHIKEESAEGVLRKDSRKIIFKAVRGMLPKNRLRKHFLRKLHIYSGEEHEHHAQKPERIEM